MEEDEVGGTCSTYGGGERCIQGLVEKPEFKRRLGRIDVGERITL